MSKQDHVGSVTGPTGRPLTKADLPPPDTKRWVIRRKAEVVLAVKTGLLKFDEACQRYGISADELELWQDLVTQHGMQGLRVTRLQRYRNRAAQTRRKPD